MKKWIIILSLLCVGSLTVSAALAGNIYYNGMETYKDQAIKVLDKNALENIYIDADIPISIQATENEAYVEFNQKFIGIVNDPPTYSVEVQTKANASSYITVKQKTSPDVWLFVKENETVCTVYLPKRAIEKLSIKNKEGLSHDRVSGPINFNLKDMDINELDIKTEDASIALEGNYKSITIDQQHGDIDINSKSPVKVKIASYNGSIRLKGKYSEIEVESNNAIAINSEIPSNIGVSGSGKINLEGAFKTVRVKSNEGNISMNNTVVPQRVNIAGNPSEVTLMLPSNLPGVEVTYQGEDYNESKQVISDFDLERTSDTDKVQKFTFGDKSLKVLVQTNDSSDLYLLDSGYTSQK